MMHPHAASQPSAATTDTSTATTPTAPMSVPVSNTSVTPVLTARLAPAAHAGQLASLSASFRTKDPFRQLIDPNPLPAAPPAARLASAAKTANPSRPAATLKVVRNATPAAKPSAPAAPAAHKVVLPFLSAVISVNETSGLVGVHTNFPTAAPLFHLLSLTKTTAKISVAGGSLASGAPTLTLHLDKPVTLANTADGTRYRLVLVSTSTKPAAHPSSQPSAPTAPTSTTPAQTTTTTTPADTIAVPPLGG
jgi:hypothetical protein